jgi:hypothetical protein
LPGAPNVFKIWLQTETRYVISSLPADAQRILYVARTHWAIENGLHWCLDVTVSEDASQIRLRNAALNFSFLRRLAINLFRTDSSRALSLPKKRKVARLESRLSCTGLESTENLMLRPWEVG